MATIDNVPARRGRTATWVRRWMRVALTGGLLAVFSAPAAGRTLVVNQAHAAAADTNPGTEHQPFKTIDAAAQRAEPGDTVLVYAGIYRERVAPARSGEEGKPITYAAAEGQRVFIRGSEALAGPWEAAGGAGIYTARLDPRWIEKGNPLATPVGGIRGRTCGQMFVDGVPLEEVAGADELAAKPGRWMPEGGGTAVRVHLPDPSRKPQECLVEVTVRHRVFAPMKRGLGYITVRGFVIEHCGNRFPSGFWRSNSPQAGMLGCRAGHHWVIENNVIRYAKTIGLDCGSEGQADADGLNQPMPQGAGHHLIRHNIIADNGCAGIAGYVHTETRVVGNIIDRNNALDFMSAEQAGVKFHLLRNGLVEGNLCRDNRTRAIWLDNRNTGSRVTRNICIGNEGQAIMVELDAGPVLVDHNVMCLSRIQDYRPDPKGDGYYMHDASGATIAHNLIFGNPDYGVTMRIVTARGTAGPDGTRQPVQVSNQKVLNNIVFANGRADLKMPFPAAKAHDNFSDGNLLGAPARLVWSRFGDSPMEALTAAAAKVYPGVEFAPEPNRQINAGRGGAGTPKPPIGLKLSFEQWRKLTGWDTHSAEGAIQQKLDPATATLELTVDEALAQVVGQPVPGVDRDFLGQPLPKEGIKPGPFQNLKPGVNRIVLWPVPGVGGPTIAWPQ